MPKLKGRASKPKSPISRVKKAAVSRSTKTSSLKSPSLPLRRRIARFFAKRPRLSLLFGLGVVTLVVSGTATMASMMNQVSVDDRASAAACRADQGYSWCGGCIRDCRLTTKTTCNGWIDKECNQGCAGEGAFAVNGQCCPNTGLIQCNNGRCGYAGPQCNPATNQQGAGATGTTTNTKQTTGIFAPAGKKLNKETCNYNTDCLSGRCLSPAPNVKICGGNYTTENCEAKGGHEYCREFFAGTYCGQALPNSGVYNCMDQVISGSCTLRNSTGAPFGNDWRKVCRDLNACNIQTGKCEPPKTVPQTSNGTTGQGATPQNQGITCTDKFSPNGCPSGSYCNENGFCRVKKSTGETCRAAFQCAVGQCLWSGLTKKCGTLN